MALHKMGQHHKTLAVSLPALSASVFPGSRVTAPWKPLTSGQNALSHSYLLVLNVFILCFDQTLLDQ